MLTLLALLTTDEALAGAKVSAFQKDSKKGSNYWSGSAAIDGKNETAWMVPGESPNLGEWIQFDLPKGDVDKIAIMPGFAKDEETFKDYPRIKKLRVDVYDLDDDQNLKQVGSAEISVEDKMELQTIDIPDIKVGSSGLFGGAMKLSVVEIYSGLDYPNFAVSELAVVLKEFDAPSAKAATATTSTDGHGIELASDEDTKTFWSGKDGAELTVTRGGYGVSSIGFIPAGKDWARPKTVEVVVGNAKLKTVLPDKVDATGVWAALPSFNGYTGGSMDDIQVTIIDSYPGAKSTDMGVSEIKFKATCLESI